MGCGITQYVKDHPMARENVLEDISVNYSGAGVGVKQVLLKAGQQVIQHKHRYAHLAILVYGKVTVVTDDYSDDLEGPDSMVIAANVYHCIVAHTDSLWLCVHSTEDLRIENLCLE